MIYKILALTLFLTAGYYPSDLPGMVGMSDYHDTELGYSFSYPESWTMVADVDQMLYVQDGPVDLIREELIPESELDTYQVMVHIPDDEYYLSNIVVFVKPLPENSGFDSTEDALDTVQQDFEKNKESGTFNLQENWLGESHAHVYRRVVPIDVWDENIQITYYLTASKTRAYMLVETVYPGSLTDDQSYMFNQVITSFRIDSNEYGDDGPGLGWGTTKPGGDDSAIDPDAGFGKIELVEDFNNNSRGWPVGASSHIENGAYNLDSRDLNPFTIRNIALGSIGFDFSYEGNVEYIDGEENEGYGLVFGYRDEDNYFAFLITNGGQFLVIEEYMGTVSQLVDWTESGFLDGDSHTLMVQGDYLTMPAPLTGYRYNLAFYIDDQQVANTVVDRIHDVSGWYGLYISRDVNVSFDWLKTRNYLINSVFSLDREIL